MEYVNRDSTERVMSFQIVKTDIVLFGSQFLAESFP